MDISAFEPARLRVARELVGMSQGQLATQTGLSAAAISQFENGAARPSGDTVAALGARLEVPVTFFTQPLTETHEGFFRSLRRTAVSDRRHARAVAYVAHDLALAATKADRFPASDVPSFALDTFGATAAQIEEIAMEVRAQWRVPPGPITNVVELLEQHGVVVIRLPLGTADVDAFSLPFADHPVVVLGNDKNDRARSRFDAAHELAHLAMHGEDIWGTKEVETQAHQFAAAFLMPAEEIRGQLPATVDWPRLFELKRRWQVSLAALLMRARTLGCMSERTYLTAVKAASARGWRRLEPVPLGRPEEPALLLSYLMAGASKEARNYLPGALVDRIAAATHAL
jgi:Zn-dependent peptidase ImmA (M78 family)/transcriptional regulator with XRE-family HTH domain